MDDEVNEKLADLVNSAFREGMPDDQFNELIKSINRPSNCESLKETRVNSGVWTVLKHTTQTEDSKLRGVQNAVIKASCNFVKFLDKASKLISDQPLIDIGMDGLGILGQANKWLNTRRKELHKKDMDPKLHYLCSSSLQSTDLLYGDSIVKDIKDAQEINKISRQVASRGRGVRGRGRFRGRGRTPYSRRRPYGVSTYNSSSQKSSSSTPKNDQREHKK